MHIGIIGGSGLLKSNIFESFEECTVLTSHGNCQIRRGTLMDGVPITFIQRHETNGKDNYVPPHLIQYRMIMEAFQKENCSFIVGIASVGSCNKSINIGSLVVPDDYMSFYDNALAMYDDARDHIVPSYNDELRKAIINALKEGENYPEITLIERAVYVQTNGPRFETKAEVRAISRVGDLIGMTGSNEATFAKQAGFPYSTLCMVDNWAHGMNESELSLKIFQELQKENERNLEKCVQSVLYKLCTMDSELSFVLKPATASGDVSMKKVKVDTLITSKYIIPVVPENVVLENHSIAIKSGKIVEILPSADACFKYSARCNEDLKDHVLIPGLINAHTHTPMVFLRGYGDDLPLDTWLTTRIWPAEGAHVNEEFIQDSMQLAIAEMIRSGTTCFNDMYFFPNVAADVVSDAGIRAVLGHILLDFPTIYASSPDDYLEKAKALSALWQSTSKSDKNQHQLVNFAMAPHAPYTVSDENWSKTLATAVELDLPIHTHLHETAEECVASVAGNTESMMCHHSVQKCRPLRNLQDLGVFNDKLIAVHMTQLTDVEISQVALSNVSVVHCPTSNLKLASGFCPVAKLMSAGANVALGTDGAASNNTLDMIGEMRLAALLAKGVHKDATACPAFTALKMATLNGARALHLDSVTGSLEMGKYADITAIDLSHIEMLPCYDVVSHVVYANSREQVSDVWVAGERLLKHRSLTRFNMKEITEKTREWSSKISSAPSNHSPTK